MSAACPRCGASDLGGGLLLCPRCLLTTDDGELPAPSAPAGLILEREIGRGGMGRVFSARHVRLDRDVAVKFLPPDLALDPSFEARFEREARALAKLVHPHIVTVHDFGVNVEGEPYLVMELVAGGTLRDRLPLPLEAALGVLRQICDGLGHAHDRGFVHRDVKPENVLLDGNGRVKLADFGLARLVAPAGASDAVTQPFWVLGTPGYLAPEALRGAPPDPRLDVFAVGALIHVLLTGQTPRNGDLSGLPSALRPIVAKATALDPAERHADASELGRSLRALDTSEGVRSSDDELPPDELSWMRAVSLALTGATSLSLYAFLASVSPRIVSSSEVLPLVTFGALPLPDGRIATRARFETMPALAAAAGWAVALATYGLLRRHWRASGLELTEPERRLRGTRTLLVLAAVINLMFVLRLALDSAGAHGISSYAPVVGGLVEMTMLYVFWMTVLEALRVSRPLRREPWLWFGLAWSLVPPVLAFVGMLLGK